jgi:hypothetical protein
MKKTPLIILTALVTVLVLALVVCVVLLVRKSSPAAEKNTSALTQNQNYTENGENAENPRLIGGQKDEHGCLIAAGYSWCESKQKCLRAWEEDCPGNTDGVGTIEGSLGYPSEFIPKQMEVCAENIDGEGRLCTAKQISDKKFEAGVGYQIEVPAGTYYVYSYLTDPAALGSSFGTDYRAYYDDFVTCGMNVKCSSHQPIKVPVGVGETVSGIDPVDWYLNEY